MRVVISVEKELFSQAMHNSLGAPCIARLDEQIASSIQLKGFAGFFFVSSLSGRYALELLVELLKRVHDWRVGVGVLWLLRNQRRIARSLRSN